MPEGEYSDCMEIKQAMKTRQTYMYLHYQAATIYIGPNKLRTEVLCDFAEPDDRPGGWTVCSSQMHFNLQLI